METQKCRLCGEVKDIELFLLRKDSGKRRTECKCCATEILRKWKRENDFDKKQYQKHRDKKLAGVWAYRANPENKPKIRACQKRWVRFKMKTDPMYRIVKNLRSRTLNALNGKGKSKKTLELLGCSGEELKRHLQSLWTEGMSWGNYGSKGWVIDHIKPIASFDLLIREQQLEAFHYKNLQPLWWNENLSKGAKWQPPENE